ncbi:MAG TPA: hypothetical protein VKD90_24085 [Gemmataceae bacterium]|nr:hypothetical protein [Gemmataceae bacterium]
MWRMITAAGLGLVVAGGAGAKDPEPKLTPAELVDAFLTNEAFADENYAGKELELTGKVVRVTRSKYGPDPEAGQAYVLELDTDKAGRKESVDLDLVIFFPERDRAQLAKLKPGQTVVVRGRCSTRAIWSAEARGKDKDYSQVYLRESRLMEVK